MTLSKKKVAHPIEVQLMDKTQVVLNILVFDQF